MALSIRKIRKLYTLAVCNEQDSPRRLTVDQYAFTVKVVGERDVWTHDFQTSNFKIPEVLFGPILSSCDVDLWPVYLKI